MTDANLLSAAQSTHVCVHYYLRSDRLCRSLLLLLRVLSDCACSEKKETLRRSLFPRARDNVYWSRRKSGAVATIDSNFSGRNSSVIVVWNNFMMIFLDIIGMDLLEITAKKITKRYNAEIRLKVLRTQNINNFTKIHK